jgi:hypothetical protein
MVVKNTMAKELIERTENTALDEAASPAQLFYSAGNRFVIAMSWVDLSEDQSSLMKKFADVKREAKKAKSKLGRLVGYKVSTAPGPTLMTAATAAPYIMLATHVFPDRKGMTEKEWLEDVMSTGLPMQKWRLG